jgi:hypothetical protein
LILKKPVPSAGFFISPIRHSSGRLRVRTLSLLTLAAPPSPFSALRAEGSWRWLMVAGGIAGLERGAIAPANSSIAEVHA